MLQRRQLVLAVLGILVVLATLAFLGYKSWYADALIVRPPDYCPTGTYPQIKEGIEVPGHTVILIDTSNEIPADDAELAFQKIDEWTRDSAPFLQRLSIYGLPESTDDRTVRSYGSWCIPKEGAEANIIYENPVYVEAQFRRFLATLEDMFRELVSRGEADQSPIVETMAGLVQRHDDLDSIVLVSDMLQNTPLSSHYITGGRHAGHPIRMSWCYGSGSIEDSLRVLHRPGAHRDSGAAMAGRLVEPVSERGQS